MTTLKRHSDGKVSRSGEIKLGRFGTSSPKYVEDEIVSHMKILKNMVEMFQRTTNNEVKNQHSGSLRRKE